MTEPGRTGAKGAGWVVRAYPHEDRAFLSDAQAAIATSWETIANSWEALNRGAGLLDAALARLRPTYPECELSMQDELARFGHDVTVIYAFRDGRAA